MRDSSNGAATGRAVQQRSIATRTALLDAAGRVFSRLSYAEARLRDISEEAGISQGSLYFHFGNKEDIATAVLEAQQEKMTSALASIIEGPESGLDKILILSEALALLMATDPIVQGGTKLSTQAGTGFESAAREPYFEWIRVATSLITQGVEDGSVHPGVNPGSAAEFVNQLFVGVQVLSELEDSWKSMPGRMHEALPHIVTVLGRAHPGS
ncbi:MULTISPECIES: ScbR family autoregulator-binding transcription factor [unclassified Plantibacter]|jgi:AcrR family transcriptional regulator|uniref:ScbR family autoregulator-binding transcription factor n=1 Tax=unclassified Plantibacter TaxID=2624265 RepID=UPI003D34DA9E